MFKILLSISIQQSFFPPVNTISVTSKTSGKPKVIKILPFYNFYSISSYS